MTRHSEALFGEVGGEPWNTETTLKAKSEVADLKLGSRIAVGKFDGTNMGVAMSNSKYFEHSTVQYALLDSEGSVRAEGVIEGPNASDETDSFGYDVVAGNYCASLGKSQRSGDILFVSAPSSSASSMYGGAVSIYGYKAGKWNEVATLSSKVDGLFGGMAIAIGDVNGDNKDDLVYFATDAYSDLSGYDYDHFSINVHSDVCGTASKGELKRDLTAIAASKATMDAHVYVRQLNATGLPEIVVVLDKAGEVSADGGYSGVVYFFKYDGSKLVQSRDPIYGDKDSELSTVAFADFTGDGETDIIVGEPLYNPLVDGGESSKFRGRVKGYANAGAGKGFKQDPTIDFLGEKDGMRFGSSLEVEDLNGDGVFDLIVGSSGGDSGPARYGSVYVYMGSNGVHKLSQEPFWHAAEDTGSATYVTKMGSSMIVSQMDGAGWPDIVTGAPQRKQGGVENVGGVSIFLNSEGHCYRADKCLIDNVCYDKGVTAPANLCNVCAPEVSNFEWSEVTCTEEADECHVPLSACVPTTGCVLEARPDGTSCGEGNSCSSNTLKTNVCLKGVCTNKSESCGNYKCDSSEASCPTSCESGSDCRSGSDIVCRSNECAVNHAPTATLIVSPNALKAGETLHLDGYGSSDPDGDTLTYKWDMGGLSGTFSSPDSAQSDYTIDTAVAAGTYTITLTVVDSYSMSCDTPARVPVTVTSNDPPPSNQPPVAEIVAGATEIYYGESATFDGGNSSDPDGDSLSYRWYLSEGGIKTQIGTDATVEVVAPQDPNHTLPEKTVQVSLIVSDGALFSEEVKVDLTFKPNPMDEVAAVEFVSPTDGSVMDSHVVAVKGTTEGEGVVTVENEDGVFCRTNVIDGVWDCGMVTFADGEHTISAIHIENGISSKATTITFSVDTGSVLSNVPVITYPANGDTTGTKPLISGTVESGEGEIYVWYENGDIDSVLCQATSKPEGNWNCLPYFTLEEGKEYTIKASMLDESGMPGMMSESVTFTVVSESIHIESPKNGDVIDAVTGLIVSGTTSTGEVVNVEVSVPSTSAVEDAVVSSCVAMVNENGTWACSLSEGILTSSDSFLPNGGYAITAVVVSGGQAYYDDVLITVDNGTHQADKSGGVRGGSCSMTTHQPVNVPWWLSLAGLGLIAIPLRRRS